MKKLCSLILAFAVCFTLFGCGAAKAETTQVVTELIPEQTEAAAEAAAETSNEKEAEPTLPAETIAESERRRLSAYQAVLYVFLKDYRGPGGEEIARLDDFGSMEENLFAIADVDGDGETELILTLKNQPVAGMVTWVCGYDAQTETVYEKLCVFPNTEFYTGGLVEAGWSHNQGMAGYNFWPYTLMGYNPAAKVYEAIAHVDAWDKDFAEVDYNGKRFPDDLDTDGTGIVYFVTQNGEEKTLSSSQYAAWREETFGSAEIIPVDYQFTNPQNIDSLTDSR